MSEIFEVNEISVPTKDGAEVAATPWFAAVFSTCGDAVQVLELLGLRREPRTTRTPSRACRPSSALPSREDEKHIFIKVLHINP